MGSNILGCRVASFQGSCGCMALLTLTVWNDCLINGADMTIATVCNRIMRCRHSDKSLVCREAIYMGMADPAVCAVIVTLSSWCGSIALMMVGCAMACIADILFKSR
ncbi:MAG: hypothetical protein OEM61_13565, partial [Desulfobacteraceae bacterium]|nr:hypothetical protein [Desulfobacteraceae bacterium]